MKAHSEMHVREGAKPLELMSDANKLIMAEAGALGALTKYLSLSPQDSSEAIVSELLKILFSSPDFLHCEASINSVNQLITVLHLESRNVRFSRASLGPLDIENIRDFKSAKQVAQSLFDMLNTAS